MPPTIATYNYAPAPCMPCMEVPPIPYGCFCALLIPPGEAAYANYNTANAAIQNQTANCIGYISPNRTSFTANFSSATQVDFSANVPSSNHNIWFSGAFQANSSITANFAINSLDGNNSSSMTAKVFSYYCNGELAGSNTFSGNTGVNISGSLTGITLPVAGEYVFLMQSFGYSGANNVVSTWNVTSNSNFVVNPVIANWQDGNNARSLWACPRLFLPPLTENNGTWYVNYSSAQSAVNSQTSGCNIYTDFLPSSYDSFSYSVSGAITVDASETSVIGKDPNAIRLYVCINALGSDSLVFDISYLSTGDQPDPTDGIITIRLYDDTGSQVYSNTAFISADSYSDSWTTSALPYTGRYIMDIYAQSRRENDPYETETTSISIDVTGSTISANPVQALYDTGLDCASRLDC